MKRENFNNPSFLYKIRKAGCILLQNQKDLLRSILKQVAKCVFQETIGMMP